MKYSISLFLIPDKSFSNNGILLRSIIIITAQNTILRFKEKNGYATKRENIYVGSIKKMENIVIILQKNVKSAYVEGAEMRDVLQEVVEEDLIMNIIILQNT
jgi:hypothetical protein